MTDILGLGVTTVDDMIYLDRFPIPDEKKPVTRTERRLGGLTAIALAAASRMGARAAYAGMLGDDDLSRFVESELASFGVDVEPVVHMAAARPVHAVIMVESQHHTRTILFSVEGPAGAADDQPSAELIESAKCLFIDTYGMPGLIRAARIARAAGIPIVADFEHDHHPDFKQLAGLTDHLIASQRFALEFTGTSSPRDAVAALWNDDRAVVAVTCGSDGCWYRSAGDDTIYHQPAYPVEVVDTTGCGDVFHGAYAAALVDGVGLADRIRIASAAAALKAANRGEKLGIPSRAQVDAFLLERDGV